MEKFKPALVILSCIVLFSLAYGSTKLLGMSDGWKDLALIATCFGLFCWGNTMHEDE